MCPQPHSSFHPWIEVKPKTSRADLTSIVRQHGMNYLQFLQQELSRTDSATTMGVFDTRAPHQAASRVRAMVDALESFLAELDEPRLVELHTPVYIKASNGREWVTSPVMLAATAIKYSQTDWTRRRFHDVHSAIRTQGLLDLQGYPKQVVDVVSFLVGLKNVARTAASQDKEVGVWRNGSLLFDDQELATFFAKILVDRWPNDLPLQTSIATTLMLLSAAYEARLKAPQDVPFQQFDDFAVFVEQALVKLAESGAVAPEGTLFALEFSKFYFCLLYTSPSPRDS